MKPDKLTSMANQIASFFRSYPDEAASSVRHHLEAFWTPAMVDTLQSHIATGAAGVDPIVVQAMHAPAGDSLVARPAAPAKEGGPIASDAG